MKKLPSILLSLTLMTGSLFAETAPPPLKDARTQAVLGNAFRCGVYYYDSRSSKLPPEELEREITRMAKLGFNYVYAAISVERPDANGVSRDYPQLDLLLELCRKHHIAVRIQAGGAAYLSPHLERELETGVTSKRWKKGRSATLVASIAAAFIRKYKDHPNVIGFLIKEEPDFTDLDPLHEYYRELLKLVPDAPLALLYNRLEVALADRENRYPQSLGADIYPFRTEGKARVNSIRTPAHALNYYQGRMNAFSQLAQYRGLAFEAVTGSFADWVVYTPESLRKRYWGADDEADLQAAYDRDMRLAKANNRGFSLSDDGKVEYWFRYFAPPRYMSALAWLSVSQGADSVALYCWKGESLYENAKKGTSTRSINILGVDDKGTRGLEEFSAFAREIRPFGKLFRTARRDVTPFKTPASGADLVQSKGRPENPLLDVDDANLVWSSFSLPGYEGKVVVVVNTLAGEWSGGSSPVYLKEEDAFRIKDGELVDFTPFTESREVSALLLHRQLSEVTDLMSGEALNVGKNDSLGFPVAPGEGRILFFAPQGSGEGKKVAIAFALPAAK